MNIYAPLFSLCLLIPMSSHAMQNNQNQPANQIPSSDEFKKMRAQTHHRTDLNPDLQPQDPQLLGLSQQAAQNIERQEAKRADIPQIHWLDLRLLQCLSNCCPWISQFPEPVDS